MLFFYFATDFFCNLCLYYGLYNKQHSLIYPYLLVESILTCNMLVVSTLAFLVCLGYTNFMARCNSIACACLFGFLLVVHIHCLRLVGKCFLFVRDINMGYIEEPNLEDIIVEKDDIIVEEEEDIKPSSSESTTKCESDERIIRI